MSDRMPNINPHKWVDSINSNEPPDKFAPGLPLETRRLWWRRCLHEAARFIAWRFDSTGAARPAGIIGP